MSHQNQIGFGTLEAWRAAIDPARPVNAEAVNRPGNFTHGICFIRQYIVLSQIDGDGQVLYWQLRTGSFESMDGGNAAFNAEKHHARALAAWDIVQAWLSEQGLAARRALVAAPRNLILLDGHTDLLRYDQANDLWRRTGDPEPALSGV